MQRERQQTFQQDPRKHTRKAAIPEGIALILVHKQQKSHLRARRLPLELDSPLRVRHPL